LGSVVPVEVLCGCEQRVWVGGGGSGVLESRGLLSSLARPTAVTRELPSEDTLAVGDLQCQARIITVKSDVFVVISYRTLDNAKI